MWWHTVAHGRGSERGNWRMEWVASTLRTTSEHGVSSITTADAHTSAASCRMNWHPRRFKWTRPFRWKTKSGFCACAITFQTQSTYLVLSSRWLWIVVTFLACAGAIFVVLHSWERYVANPTVVALDKGYRQWSTLFPAVTICPLQNVGSNGSELEVRR